MGGCLVLSQSDDGGICDLGFTGYGTRFTVHGIRFTTNLAPYIVYLAPQPLLTRHC